MTIAAADINTIAAALTQTHRGSSPSLHSVDCTCSNVHDPKQRMPGCRGCSLFGSLDRTRAIVTEHVVVASRRADMEDVSLIRERLTDMPAGQAREDVEALLATVAYLLSHEARGEDGPREQCRGCDMWFPAGDTTDGLCIMCEGPEEVEEEGE